jgi:hypothetical protein
VVVDARTYDAAGRVVTQTERYGGAGNTGTGTQAVRVSINTYDADGRLILQTAM